MIRPGADPPSPAQPDAVTQPEPPPQFYRSVVDDAADLIEADEIQGVDRELSLLRVKFREEMDASRAAMLDNPEQYALMLKSIEMIVRTVSARYRMSAKKSADLAQGITDVLDRMGLAFWGEGAAPL
ncbi:MAG: hypothetical protein M3P30_04340 [Chloroflexota bacterium]|nr:hypothetical protein [Chloroflexota bacterium]